MTAFFGSRNGRSHGWKVAMVLHAAVGSPQMGACFAGRRFWADIAPVKKISAVVVAIKAATTTRSPEGCDVRFKLAVVGLLIVFWEDRVLCLKKLPRKRAASIALVHFSKQRPIGNRKCFWRRGWDSNPRNGFPLTAFPVLPIQPLLHLSSIANFRLPIANWSPA